MEGDITWEMKRKRKYAAHRLTGNHIKSYNKELVRRGKNIASAIKEQKSYNEKEELENMNLNKNGSPFDYTDRFVILLAILKSITGMSYRVTEGLGHMFSDKVLCYTQLCRRINSMPIELIEGINRRITKTITKGKDTIDVLMDGTGVMVNGTYVWIDEKTGAKRRREWKKLHFVIDRKSKAILLLEVIDKHKNEAENESMKETMINTLDNIDDNTTVDRAFGDGLYDSYNNFEMFGQAGIELVTRIREPSVDVAKSLAKSKIVSEKALRRFKSHTRNRIEDFE